MHSSSRPTRQRGRTSDALRWQACAGRAAEKVRSARVTFGGGNLHGELGCTSGSRGRRSHSSPLGGGRHRTNSSRFRSVAWPSNIGKGNGAWNCFYRNNRHLPAGKNSGSQGPAKASLVQTETLPERASTRGIAASGGKRLRECARKNPRGELPKQSPHGP